MKWKGKKLYAKVRQEPGKAAAVSLVFLMGSQWLLHTYVLIASLFAGGWVLNKALTPLIAKMEQSWFYDNAVRLFVRRKAGEALVVFGSTIILLITVSDLSRGMFMLLFFAVFIAFAIDLHRAPVAYPFWQLIKEPMVLAVMIIAFSVYAAQTPELLVFQKPHTGTEALSALFLPGVYLLHYGQKKFLQRPIPLYTFYPDPGPAEHYRFSAQPLKRWVLRKTRTV